MNFDAYKTQGQLTGPANNQDHYNVLNGGAVALQSETNKTGDTVVKGLNLMIQQHENIRALDANNYYNKMVSDGIMKIQQGKEENALDALAQFDQMEQKAYAATKKKYGKYLYGRTGSVFEQARSKDINTRRQQMEKYQNAEQEKYQNNVMINGLQANLKEASENLNDMDVVKNCVGKAMAQVEGRFWSHGNEKIQAEKTKVLTQMVGTLMQSAQASGDVQAANRILNTYGKDIDQKVRLQFVKSIGDVLKEDYKIGNFEDMYTRSNGDPEMYGTLLKKFVEEGDGVNAVGAVNAARSSIGEKRGTNTCTLFVIEKGSKNGYKFTDRDRYVPHNLEDAKKEGRAFTDRAQLRDGDLVYWDTNNNEADGADHVGIWDAQKGRAIQSGTSGVGYMDLDSGDGKLVGFAHPRVDPEKQSPAARKRMEQEGWALFNQKQHEANIMASQKYDDFMTAIAGVKDVGSLQAIASRFHSNDPNAERILQNKIKQTIGRFKAGRSSNPLAGSGKVSSKAGQFFEQARLNGTFPSDQAMMDYAYSFGDPAIAQAAEGVRKKSENHEGAFSFSFNSIKDDVMYDYPGKKEERDRRWAGIANEGYEWINSFRVEHGRMPTNSEVADHCREALVNGRGDAEYDGLFGNKTTDSLKLYDVPEVKWYTSMGDNRYRVQFRGAETPTVIDGQQLADIVGGKNWREAVGDAAPRK